MVRLFVRCGRVRADSRAARAAPRPDPLRDARHAMSNPILIEVTRGALVESAHSGSIAVSDSHGRLLLQLGDVLRPVYPRSSIKALQCLPLIETGAAEHYGFGDEEIALACASHSGSERHAAIALRMLERIGLGDGLASGHGVGHVCYPPWVGVLIRLGRARAHP